MSITDQPNYELSPTELAAWIEQQGFDIWWAIDGDLYLSSRLPTPCRGDELATVLRRATRPLLVMTRNPRAAGQTITRDALDEVADRVGSAVHVIDPSKPKPSWADDRCFWMSWKGDGHEWLLAEDSDATKAFRDVETHPLTIT